MTRKRFFLRFSEALDSIKLSKDEVIIEVTYDDVIWN